MDFLGLGKVAEGILGGLDSLFTSDKERLDAQTKIMAILQKPHMIQAMITLEEAKSSSKFKSWWRPALGWICVIGLGLNFLVFPIAEAILSAFPEVDFQRPDIDAGTLMTLVLTLLGLGGMRTYEKFKGLTK